jgi:hypothetical protein
MLNDNLRLEMLVQMNGKMLHDTPIFTNFDLQFVSELTFLVKRETFALDDTIFHVNFMFLFIFYRKEKEAISYTILIKVMSF